MDNADDFVSDESAEISPMRDEIIPVKLCNENSERLESDINIYCPDYRDSDFLYGDWNTDNFSWLYLSINYCNN